MEQYVSQRVYYAIFLGCVEGGVCVCVCVCVRVCACVSVSVRVCVMLLRCGGSGEVGAWGFDGSGNGSEELNNCTALNGMEWNCTALHCSCTHFVQTEPN